MASSTAGSSSDPGSGGPHGSAQNGGPKNGGPKSETARFVEYDHFIDDTLRRTRRQVRNLDIAGGLLLLGAGTLAYFLVAALFDHWVVPGGLGPVMRWGALAIFAVGALAYIWRSLVPLVLRRINPVYAAHSIERTKPSLKNSLVNFLLLRANPAGLTQNVYEAIEEQAATGLAQVPADAAIDRSKLIRIGYLFLAVLLVSAIYKVVSPKDPLRTIGRVVLPWADIDPPTRVRIVAIRPENATVFRGQTVPVTVEVLGLSSGQPVTLDYTTADGQLVERAIEMHVPADGYAYACALPEGKEGMQQDLAYRIVAGDAVSHTFHLTVEAAPTIVVESVDYRYPDYTGLVSQSTAHQADIKGIEGTAVTIRAVANQPIKSAHIDFDSNNTDDQPMTFADRQASVTFTLALKEDRRTPTHTSYQLRFTNADGQENIQPIRHQIEVTPDVAPEIQFLAPKNDAVEVPLDGLLTAEILANDPDYALERVALAGAIGGRPLFSQVLLKEARPGQFGAKPRLAPQKWRVKPGDVVEYWAWAEDNKSPAPNRTETPHRRIKITSPSGKHQAEDQLAANDPRQKQPDDKRGKQGDRPNADQNENAQNKDAEGQDSQAGKSDQEPGDQQGQQERGEGGAQDQQGDSGQSDGPQDQGARGDKQSGQGQGDKQQSGDEQGAGQGQEPGEDQQPGGAQAGDKQEGDKQGGGQGQPRPDGAQSGAKNGDSQQQGAKEPVAKDGSQDGEAFEKILERQPPQEQPKGLKPQENPQSGGKSSGDEQKKQIQGDQQGGSKPQPAGAGEKPSDPSGEKGPQGGKSEQGEGGNDSGEKAPPGSKGSPHSSRPGGSGEGEQNDQPGKPTGEAGGKAGGEPLPDDGSQGESGDAAQPQPGKQDPKAGQAKAGQAKADKNAQDKSGQKGQSEENSGEDTRPGAQAGDKSGQGARSKGSPQQKSQAPPAGEEKPEARGGDGDDDKGQSGAGRSNGRDKDGTPSPHGQNRQRNKTPSGQKNPSGQPGGEPPSPGISDRQSDSQGDQSGDRTGGGSEGGGQKANRAGTGGAGQNTTAEEGAGASNERGEGDAANRPGADEEAPAGQAGQSGNRAGQGSQSRPKTGAGQPGGKPDQAGGQAPQPGQNPEAQPQGGQPGTEGGNGRGVPAGSGHTDTAEPPPPAAAADQADEANLEFTRKATELAIRRLRDQLDKGKVDPKLLDDLGWEQDDLDRLVRRYEEMYRHAQARGEEGRRAKAELDASLRSLGIRPRGTRIGAHLSDDRTHGLKEGRRSPPPAEYMEQYKAYTQGTSRIRPQPADKSPNR